MLNYHTYGTKSDNAIVFLHGFLGNSEDWSFLIRELSGKYFCIAIDLPGHGKSINLQDNQYSINAAVSGIYGIVEQLNISKINLIAYSMGGRAALHFTDKYPDIVNKLVLISSSPGLKTKGERQSRIALDKALSDRISASNFSDFLKFWYSQKLFGYDTESKKYSFLAEKRRNNLKEELSKSLKYSGTGAMQHLWDKLSNYDIPILLLCGENDEKYIRINSEMNDILKNSELKIIDDSFHNIIFDAPESTFKEINNFLNKKYEKI